MDPWTVDRAKSGPPSPILSSIDGRRPNFPLRTSKGRSVLIEPFTVLALNAPCVSLGIQILKDPFTVSREFLAEPSREAQSTCKDPFTVFAVTLPRTSVIFTGPFTVLAVVSSRVPTILIEPFTEVASTRVPRGTSRS